MAEKFFSEKNFDSSLFLSANPDDSPLKFLESSVGGHKESSYGYTTKWVCKECNSGWMSRLEEQVKAILVSDAGSLLEELSCVDENDLQTISKWVLKIALLLFNKITDSQNFPLQVYNNLKNGYIPNGVLIEVATSKSAHDLNFIISKGGTPLLPIKSDNIPKSEAIELAENFFVVSIQIGKLLFRLSYLDTDSPLQRKICLIRTKVLYPKEYQLPFHQLKENKEEEILSRISDKLELYMFNSGIILTDS